jgi:fatty-acyl-CoA synthase
MYYLMLLSKTTLQNTLHYEDLLAEQSDEYEWPVLNE